MTTIDVDMDEVGAFAQQVGGMLIGGATAALMVVGDRTGLYAAMARCGPVTPTELAVTCGLAVRYVQEWLAQQAAAGIVEYDPSAGTFTLPPEHAMVLADDASPASLIGAAPLVSGMHRRIDALTEAFRTGAGIPWGEQDPVTWESTERFFRTGYRRNLVDHWIPALDGVGDRLREGAAVVDVGCGHGAALLLMAEAFPRSTFTGYDVHAASVDTARQRAAEAGVSDRVRFSVDHAGGYPDEGVDLITFFDTFHDLGDPVGAADHARRALAPGGTLVLVELHAGDDLAQTLATEPLAALGYAASTFLCTPNSLSQPGAMALGAHAGPLRLREVLEEAGFTSVRVAAEDDVNIVLEARLSDGR